MELELVRKYSAPVPRYTSYPTAPHFSGNIGPEIFQEWLKTDLQDDPISLYLHIPFCKSLCWYCGCNTKATRRYEPIARYFDVLLDEMRLVRDTVGRRQAVGHLHLGGGSPDILSPRDIIRLGIAVRENFQLTTDNEFAVEIDPRNADVDRVDAFSQIGVNRVSFGVQDFDPNVQEAINRYQSYAETAQVISRFRDAGVPSVNVDLIFGLPKQTRDSIEQTVEHVIELQPDRIALFGYAHLPGRIAHQRMIDGATLPGTTERFAQANRAASLLTNAGYVRVGLDHFALPHDSLVTNPIRRNFQGYTSDNCTTLLGLGASAISHLPTGYAQNAVPTANYMRSINNGCFATAKGYALNDDDRLRGAVIEDLMCRLKLCPTSLRERFGVNAEAVIEEAEMLTQSDADGLVAATEDGFEVTERGRPFIRTICSCFDAYLGQSEATHATGV